MKWPKRKGTQSEIEATGPASLSLAPLVAHLAAEVPRLEGTQIDAELLRARLADRCRDAAIQPAPPDLVGEMFGGLDPESLRRLALTASALDLDEVRAAAPTLLGAGPIFSRVRTCFVDFARGGELLTLELLRQSPLRVEEFARKWLAALGADIIGETAEESKLQRERLDYGRLLAETERAKQAAEPRLAELRRLQEERSQRARRGKV